MSGATLRPCRIVVHHSDGWRGKGPWGVNAEHAHRGWGISVTAEDYPDKRLPSWVTRSSAGVACVSIGYHYYITADGTVYDCRPPTRQGAHCCAGGRNRTALGVCLAGHLDDDRPTDAQIEALVELLCVLCVRYALPVSVIEGHRDVPGARTDCPGRHLHVLLDGIREEVASRLPSDDGPTDRA